MLMPDLAGAIAHLSGSTLRGRLWDTRHRWQIIRECQLHAVTPFQGRRFSVVAYSRVLPSGVPGGVVPQLVAPGFPVCPPVVEAELQVAGGGLSATLPFPDPMLCARGAVCTLAQSEGAVACVVEAGSSRLGASDDAEN